MKVIRLHSHLLHLLPARPQFGVEAAAVAEGTNGRVLRSKFDCAVLAAASQFVLEAGDALLPLQQ